MSEIRKISIILDNRSFEYDVYTLVIAFFQGVETRVYDPGQEIPADTDLLVDVKLDCTGEQAGGQEQTNIPALSISLRGRGESEVEGDAPERIEPVPDADNRPLMKNILKRTLYEMLREYCKRDLPWGNLTGIRPVKLAMDLLHPSEEGSSDPAQDAASYARRKMTERYYVSDRKADLAVRIAQRESAILEKIRPQEGFSLYVGIPFCPSICLYCSFSSSPLKLWEKKVDEYLDALEKEIRSSGNCFPGKRLQTVYVGGGTPTTLEPYQLERLLTVIEETFDMSGVLEYTVEAGRPDSITREKLEVLRRHHISRISINPQTMNQKTLDLIGRRHTVEQTKEAFLLARSMGFDNINMDLIVGLPGEGIREVEHTMEAIEALDPDDVTVHALALKRAARLALHMDEYEKISFKVSDDIMRRCEEGCERLQMTPYYLYRQKNIAGNFENVGYAKSHKAGLYNILIMEEVQCILACGASGSTKIVYDDGRIERIENVKDIRSYLDRIDEMIDRKNPIR